jgi:hypothetical protein
MEELRFRADWKRGLDQRPVKSFTLLTMSTTQPDFEPGLGIKECWIYEFVVEDTEVPISDHLIFYIVSPENRRLARMSASV